MGQSQQTFRKKEIAKKKLQKRKEKEEKKAQREDSNDKGKSLEEMFAYVDENGNISDKPPVKKYEFKEEDLIRPEVEDVYSFGKVSFYNEAGQYGFIRDNETRENVYFNFKILGFVLHQDQKVKFKSQSSKQGLQVTEVIVL
ncbi:MULTISPECIES: cold-shock protein [Sphingobacterium]|jgi:CspA family cold shock protein|uniref:Cold shock domain-containing protein n=1 Tax=Sphingobacterium litopenaei TaxID=2763500 RepID=A0ABR7YFV8_9SPHI|nr:MULTISPECIES: cold shock domain-containing protein [Sphingobacterium]MBD1430108.1 cold shock domain-containing protein [Sphingobacterium litopenaei]NGM72264.1 cold shock domain-containing protein [Sphingobacterium sp. SGL-16]